MGANMVARCITRRGSSALGTAKGARAIGAFLGLRSHRNKVPVGCVMLVDSTRRLWTEASMELLGTLFFAD